MGVITPYKQQYFLLQRTFAAALDKATYSAIDINTIVRAALLPPLNCVEPRISYPLHTRMGFKDARRTSSSFPASELTKVRQPAAADLMKMHVCATL